MTSFFFCQAHKSGDTMTWLEVSGYNLLKHAPYSPDLAVSDLSVLDKNTDRLR